MILTEKLFVLVALVGLAFLVTGLTTAAPVAASADICVSPISTGVGTGVGPTCEDAQFDAFSNALTNCMATASQKTCPASPYPGYRCEKTGWGYVNTGWDWVSECTYSPEGTAFATALAGCETHCEPVVIPIIKNQ